MIGIDRWDVRGHSSAEEREGVLCLLLALMVARYGPLERIAIAEAIAELARRAPGCGLNVAYRAGQFASVHLCRVPDGPENSHAN